jgi:hypothetical protein
MRPRNFPKHKELRRLRAEKKNLNSAESIQRLEDARNIRTKQTRTK